ncbi:MAG: polyprenyl diphosphate synthase [Candidatus Peribacteraceae bacterium]|jgi:undecaprenyl diphosphate synthase|nr:polyprenyl diphosphate synthase [Candidatus Peribacteraceae bacterium]MDP7454139.1 polyprenyl diphosphate synthase [Candidatus Peribacteraceae bacterium]MDP7646344.1 polyprenyl diphosphate synthase [Candidatus Peribacteraceae bacterium]|tara:strand:- start:305 stop:970 length:666 start_codon:yes stop_codon:yes gene_type:complete
MNNDNAIHLGIIPDGNRRWAKSRSLNPWKGHEQAIENFKALTEWCRNDERISVLTVWCFSTENWKRERQEIEMLMKMLEDYLRKEQENFIENKTKFCHSGRKDRIPSSLAELIKEAEEKTSDQTDFTLHLAVDYGGKDEIERAARKISPESPLKENLDHPELPDIDIIIRTSGEKRTSNFFMWQAAYAEWIFEDKLFPDFSIDDLQVAVDNFSDRNRRFGE